MCRRTLLAAVGLSATVPATGCLDAVFGRDLRPAERSVSERDDDADFAGGEWQSPLVAQVKTGWFDAVSRASAYAWAEPTGGE